MYRDEFIDDVAAGLKDKIGMVLGSMDLNPELLPAFKLGMQCATDVILNLTDGNDSSKAPYRIYPVEYVAVPEKDPITFYDYSRGTEHSKPNDLIAEIWDKVNS